MVYRMRNKGHPQMYDSYRNGKNPEASPFSLSVFEQVLSNQRRLCV
jgi:hypothetical protein